MKNQLINSLLALVFMAGCATAPTPVDVQIKQIPRAKIELPEPTPIKMEKVKWVAMSKDNKIVFTLTADEMKKLESNMTKIKGLLIEEKTLLKNYKAYYEDTGPPS